MNITDNKGKDNSQEDQNKDKPNSKQEKESSFECTICLDVAKEPVVTKCGHLFCWPCLFHWMERKKVCPNCNNPITTKDLVPIYNKDQNSSNTDRFKIPNRPKGERNPTSQNNQGDTNFFSNVHFSFGFPFFGFGMNFTNNQRQVNPNPFNNVFNNVFNDNTDPEFNKAMKHFLCLIFLMYFLSIFYY